MTTDVSLPGIVIVVIMSSYTALHSLIEQLEKSKKISLLAPVNNRNKNVSLF